MLSRVWGHRKGHKPKIKDMLFYKHELKMSMELSLTPRLEF